VQKTGERARQAKRDLGDGLKSLAADVGLSKKHRQVNSSQYVRDVKRMKAYLGEEKKRQREAARCLLDPSSRTMYVFDLFNALALMYTAFVTPFEVSFISANLVTITSHEEYALQRRFWLEINHLVDWIFLIDIVLQFFIMFEAPRDTNSRHFVSNRGTIYVASHKLIAQRYMRSFWFWIDLITLLPSCIDWIPDASLSDQDADSLFLLRILRVARLLKLIRLVKYQRIYERVVSRFNMSNTLAVGFRVTFSVVLVSHWFACFFALLATLHPHVGHTYWTMRGFCPRVYESGESNGGHEFLNECDLDMVGWYMASLTWAILVVTATGGTDSYPSLSYLENAFISVFNLLAALFWTTVLATFCDLISKTNPEIAEFHQSSTADGQHTQT